MVQIKVQYPEPIEPIQGPIRIRMNPQITYKQALRNFVSEARRLHI